MKKIDKKAIMAAIVLSISYSVALAQNKISRADAVFAAQKIAISRFPVTDTTIQEVICRTSDVQDTLLYEVKMRGGKTVLLSGDRRCKPVLGVFDNNTNISVLRDEEKIPIPLKKLILKYERNIASFINLTSDTAHRDAGWDTLTSRIELPTRTSSNLISSQWGPSVSNDGNDLESYNCHTPVIDGCQTTAGSAAVAMGQLMYYWRYPNFRTSTYDFIDWCDMSNGLYTGSVCYEDQKKAISTLLYECGRASSTEYSCNYSETTKNNVRNSLKNHFRYKVGNYHLPPLPGAPDPPGVPSGQADFELMYNFLTNLKEEIDEGRPMIGYSTENGKKYFFLCDGYIRNGVIDFYFHFNWGWNGLADGDFKLVELTPNEHDFSLNLEMLTGIEPEVDMTEYETILDLTQFYDEYSSLLSSIPPYELVPGTSNVLMSADTTSLESRRTISSGEVSVYQAFNEVVLRPGFTAERGSDFTARIEPCEPCETAMLELRMEDGDASEETHADTTLIPRVYRIGDTTFEVRQSALRLYPNPTEQQLTIGSAEEVKDIRLYDQRGHAVYRWYVSRRGADGLTLEVGDIPTGTYIVHVTTLDGRTHMGRFVKK